MYERVKIMNKELYQLFLDNNNTVSCKLLLENGLNNYQIKKLIDENHIYRLKKGLYALKTEFEDIFFYSQMNNKYMIYSNETALYLHDLCDRFPNPLSVTTKTGFHLRNNSLKKYYVNEEVLFVGVMEMVSPQGNIIYVYDKERTICDLVKNKNRIELQSYIQGLQTYFMNGKPRIRKLLKYAKQLKVENKLRDIVALYTKA